MIPATPHGCEFTQMFGQMKLPLRMFSLKACPHLNNREKSFHDSCYAPWCVQKEMNPSVTADAHLARSQLVINFSQMPPQGLGPVLGAQGAKAASSDPEGVHLRGGS